MNNAHNLRAVEATTWVVFMVVCLGFPCLAKIYWENPQVVGVNLAPAAYSLSYYMRPYSREDGKLTRLGNFRLPDEP